MKSHDLLVQVVYQCHQLQKQVRFLNTAKTVEGGGEYRLRVYRFKVPVDEAKFCH